MAELAVCARRPVEPRRAIVRAAVRDRGRLEDANRLGVVAALVRPPAGAPGRAVGERAGREARVHLREDLRGFLVLVLEDVEGAELVQRALRPRRLAGH